MATVSGTFTAVGLSAVLDVTMLGEDITISLTGGATATVELQRELVPYADAWHPIRTYTGNVDASFRQERKNERYRFECTSYTSGTITYSVSDGDKQEGSFEDSEGNEVLTWTQAGVTIPGTLDVTGTFSPGTLALGSGSITDSSGAISFGDENLTTTGTAATGALSVTGAISDTAASTFTTGATIGNVTVADGSITDSSGAISFGDENLSTTGTLAAGVTTLDGIVGGDSSLGIDGEATAQGGAVSVQGGTSSTAGNAGGAVDLTGGTGGATGLGGAATVAGGLSGSTSGTGGLLTLEGGSGGATAGTGGNVALTSGAGTGAAGGLSGTVVLASGTTATVTSETASASGAVVVESGAAGTATTGIGGASGAVTVQSAAGGASTGASSTAGAAGLISITGGIGGASSGGSDTAGAGGRIAIAAGSAGSGTTGGAGGNLTLDAGDATVAAAAGLVLIEAGQGGTTSTGGIARLLAGAGGTSSGAGGAVTIRGGVGTAGDANGGDVVIEGGAEDGSGAAGVIHLGPVNCDIINVGHSASTTNQLGTMSQANQPAFLAYNSASDDNATGSASTATIDFDTEIFDQGADFATDTFTAPVTGRYYLSATVRFLGLVDASDYSLTLVTSNRNYINAVVISVFSLTTDTLTINAVTDMDASDTVTVTLDVNGESGGDIVDIFGDGTATTSFSGCLLA